MAWYTCTSMWQCVCERAEHRRANDETAEGTIESTLRCIHINSHIKYRRIDGVRYKVKWYSAHQTTQQVSITWANGKHN